MERKKNKGNELKTVTNTIDINPTISVIIVSMEIIERWTVDSFIEATESCILSLPGGSQ